MEFWIMKIISIWYVKHCLNMNVNENIRLYKIRNHLGFFLAEE